MKVKFKRILFASDLSANMKQIFEQAAAMSTYLDAELIIVHVMEEGESSSQKQVRMVFGEDLFESIKNQRKEGARNILIGKNTDALKIRQAISGLLTENDPEKADIMSPVADIIVVESSSVANELIEIAKEKECDFIITGCKQQGLIAKAMGSKLIRKILKRSPIPVLVIPITNPE